MLAGRPPFCRDSVLDTLMAVLTEEPPNPRSVNPDADRDLAVVALKCLDKDPGKRYPSAEALADDLDRWLRHEPIAARPAGRVERARKWVRRNPAVAALLAAVAASLVLGTAAASALAVRATAPAERADRNAAAADDKREETRQQLYRSQMQLAQAAWDRIRDRLVRRSAPPAPQPGGPTSAGLSGTTGCGGPGRPAHDSGPGGNVEQSPPAGRPAGRRGRLGQRPPGLGRRNRARPVRSHTDDEPPTGPAYAPEPKG